eukprot:TRINITY_DN8339_c0_g2_i3.p1 TRINITY_DN8339_c0_g2~~TRINITY_DN8339_c0_g2_i3.p1  ORF type:complete len:181 (-),score=46.14 TRINITY_DN8339_c0_g2_i3:15-557(-)
MWSMWWCSAVVRGPQVRSINAFTNATPLVLNRCVAWQCGAAMSTQHVARYSTLMEKVMAGAPMPRQRRAKLRARIVSHERRTLAGQAMKAVRENKEFEFVEGPRKQATEDEKDVWYNAHIKRPIESAAKRRQHRDARAQQKQQQQAAAAAQAASANTLLQPVTTTPPLTTTTATTTTTPQ